MRFRALRGWVRLWPAVVTLLACRPTDRLVPCPEAPEVCNGVDDDCDGAVDEDPSGEAMSRACASACGPGLEICRGGSWLACDAAAPRTEVCNGVDDDCDGQADDVTDIRFCYPPADATVMHGECRPGVERCEFGSWACYNWRGPSYEACDGLDNDCDGVVDEDFKPADVLALVDSSCSMAWPYGGQPSGLSLARDALCAASKRPHRFKLVDVGEAVPRDVTGWTDGATVCAAVQRLPAYGGSEPTLDALADVGKEQWASDVRIVLLWSDEPPQSYRNPPVTPADAKAALAGTIAYAWGDSEFAAIMPTRPLSNAGLAEAEAAVNEGCR